ncbi:4-(cytidine 5'-diphospho)-2-C-methyl-D-erythritol kinase [Marinoscillum sp. MHG1-6]|uniref:4-(cytidine 5'-diphospho)-2-C-methyl-D-erythritol kinase n=1 Tax=Marinoscillum sp. MHG1-6 TaxID=2959627 RepID=UPI0021571030|nr:4-(cytidine 5'-diphospho)-2-C-methyl-D-erythritol kinase [Marinoscillum sp. MHG1-6]
MICFPNAKINLGLNVVSKRTDGYHNIETCFYPVPWTDVLEIIPSDQLTFNPSGLSIPGNADSNLCLKAYYLLKEEFDLPPVSIYLHKVIPMGAGLGGGSSDGAYTLKLLNELFALKLSTQKLETLSGKLGSDCPFFIQNQPAFATGTGTDFSPVNVSLKGMFIALTHPRIHVSTWEAYAGINPQKPAQPITEIINQPLSYWRENLINDFESSIFSNHPAIKQIKEDFYTHGAVYSAMSGSGSCVFGIFENEAPQLQCDAYFPLD